MRRGSPQSFFSVLLYFKSIMKLGNALVMFVLITRSVQSSHCILDLDSNQSVSCCVDINQKVLTAQLGKSRKHHQI